MGRAGIKRGSDQRGLARQRDSGALEEDEGEQHPQAIGLDQRSWVRQGREQAHGGTTFGGGAGPEPGGRRRFHPKWLFLVPESFRLLRGRKRRTIVPVS